MLNEKLINAVALKGPTTAYEEVIEIANKLKEEESMKKVIKKVQKVERVRINRSVNGVNIDTTNANISSNRPWEGLQPGTNEWMLCWKANPSMQNDMIAYKDKYEEEHMKKRVVKRVQIKRDLGSTDRAEVEKRKRDEEKQKIEEFIKRNGVTKVGHGQAEAVVEPVSYTYEDIQNMKRASLIKVIRSDEDLRDVIDDIADMEDDELREAICEALELEPSEVDDEIPIQKEEPMKKAVRVVKPVQKAKEEEVMTKDNPFLNGETFFNYATELPENIKTLKQLREYLLEDHEGKCKLVEFKHGQFRVYNNKRVTNSGREALLCPKVVGSGEVVPTYRSNARSKIVK